MGLARGGSGQADRRHTLLRQGVQGHLQLRVPDRGQPMPQLPRLLLATGLLLERGGGEESGGIPTGGVNLGERATPKIHAERGLPRMRLGLRPTEWFRLVGARDQVHAECRGAAQLLPAAPGAPLLFLRAQWHRSGKTDRDGLLFDVVQRDVLRPGLPGP